MLIDAQLLSRLRARDEALLTELFRELNPYFLRVLAGRGLTGAHAEEIVCETWLTFLSKLDAFEGRSTVKTYLTGILLHKAQEHLRRQKRESPPEEDLETLYEKSFTAKGKWKTPPKDPFEVFGERELRELVEKCLEGLSPQQRNVFVLKELEGENTEIICESLKISVSNLGVLIFRAKEKLKRCLAGSQTYFS